ncbi:MAG: hypothetical protein AAB639_02590 [Patescibacteria group bacterium]
MRYKQRLRVERLARHEEQAVIKRVITLFIVTIALGIFMLTLGIPLLGKFADLLDVVFKNDDQENQAVPLPPTLDELPVATNSSKLKVSGFAGEGEKVDIYVNDNKKASTNIADSRFEYENLTLVLGENKISVVAISNGREGDFSQTRTVTYDHEEPKLEIKTPTDGQAFYGDNRVRVEGTTDRDAQVFANGFLASIDFEGKFEVFVPVGEGESQIEIKAVDLAGNTKTETRKVTFRK